MPSRIKTYAQFWDYYLQEHAQPSTRAWHYLGTASVIALAAASVANPWLLLALPIAGYAPAWGSHFFIERNKPATFTHPLWSLISDFRMFALAITGRLKPHLERALPASARQVHHNSAQP